MKLPLFVAGAALLIIVLVEIIGLIYIYASVPRFQSYWQNRRSKHGELIYIALGDSTAQGVGASRASHSYVGKVAERLEKESGKTVRTINLSVSGARINDVLYKQLPQLKTLPPPDLVTVGIGSNDVSGFNESSFRESFRVLVKNIPSGTYISDLPDFGDGPSLKDQRTGAKIARQIISQRQDVTLVPLEDFTNKNFHHWFHSSFDLFHPNNRGYGVWADIYWSTIKNNEDAMLPESK